MNPIVFLTRIFTVVLYDTLSRRTRLIKATYIIYLDDKGNWRVNPDVKLGIIDYVYYYPPDIEKMVIIPYSQFEQKTQAYCQFLEAPEAENAIAQYMEKELIRTCSI